MQNVNLPYKISCIKAPLSVASVKISKNRFLALYSNFLPCRVCSYYRNEIMRLKA